MPRVFEEIIQQTVSRLSYLQNEDTEDYVALTVLTSILNFCDVYECMHYFKEIDDSGITDKDIEAVVESVIATTEENLLFDETNLDKISSPKRLINALTARLQMNAFDGALYSQITKQFN